MRMGEGTQQCGDVVLAEKRFVALDVDVNLGIDELGYGVDSIGAAREIGRSEMDWPGILMAQRDDFFRVGGDDDLVELRACARRRNDPGEEWASGDLAEDFAGQAGGGEAGGNDAEGFDWSRDGRIGDGGRPGTGWIRLPGVSDRQSARGPKCMGRLHSQYRFTYHS
jgi:hypothetical protein